MFREWQTAPMKNFLGQELLFLRQILVTDERRIAHDTIERPRLLGMKQKPLEKIARVNLNGQLAGPRNSRARFCCFLSIAIASSPLRPE